MNEADLVTAATHGAVSGAIEGTANAVRNWVTSDNKENWGKVVTAAESLVQLSKDVQSDYIDGFKQIKMMVEQESTPTHEIIDFIENRRTEKLNERKELDNFSKVIAKNVNDNKAANQCLIELSNAVTNYLKRSSGLFDISWFSDFKNHFTNLLTIADSDSNIVLSEFISESKREELLYQLDLLLQTDFDLAYEPVYTAYQKLLICELT